MNRKIHWAWAVGVAMAIVVSACSSSSHSSSSSSSATSGTTTATPTGAPIKIGFISSDTINGSPGDFGNDVPTTASRWQDYVNSHGGINGHPVDVIVKDDQTTAAIAVQDFHALQNDGAVVIGDFSFVDEAFQKQADAAHIPVVGAASASSAVYLTDPNFFPTSYTVDAGPWEFAKSASVAGVKKLAVVYCAEVAGCAQYAAALKQVGPPLGVTVSYTGSFSASSPNYTAQCLAAQKTSADGLFVSAASTSAANRVVDNCAQQGWKPIYVAGSVNPELLADKNIETAVIPDPVLPWFVNSSATAAFHQAMDSYIPSATVGGWVVSWIWANLEAIATAAERGVTAGATPTSQDIYTGLYTFKGETLGGLTPPLTYTQGKPTSNGCFYIVQFGKGAQPSTPYGLNPICKPAS